jgi:hypothetical protein
MKIWSTCSASPLVVAEDEPDGEDDADDEADEDADEEVVELGVAVSSEPPQPASRASGRAAAISR